MQFQLIVLALFFNFIRVRSKVEVEYANWKRLSIAGLAISIGLLVTAVAIQKPSMVLYLIVYPVIATIIFLIFWKKEWHPLKARLYIVLPAVIVNFIADSVNLMGRSVALKYQVHFLVGGIFSVIWLAVAAFLHSKQEKALQKQRQIAEAKAMELEITEKIMSQLEMQVAERTAEITRQKAELEQTIEELHKTQTQLIHAEKMASLGELTAGIAHEIQNPLNFVNNFSDLSKELMDEMNEELDKGDIEEAKFIAADIKSNLEKINHHGKRADSIVRGMLQHSRTSSSEKQETDINKLSDEYLRLSYHGLRSKEKDFNADIVTSFDESIGKIFIAPQEIGRVILNMVNNAFYAVHEKSKTITEAGYKPIVSVFTKRNDHVVTISISDNGNGIPDKIKDKIFNPFFTTKPTGQGTGLGLSLSYDIVKAHGGEIKLQSSEGNGTTFTIQLPIT